MSKKRCVLVSLILLSFTGFAQEQQKEKASKKLTTKLTKKTTQVTASDSLQISILPSKEEGQVAKDAEKNGSRRVKSVRSVSSMTRKPE